jgi:putative aldouronate transport system permease protein
MEIVKKTAVIRNRHSPKRKSGVYLLLMTMPFLIGIFVFAYCPLFGWAYAFVDYRPGFSIFNMPFVGLKWFEIPFSNAVLRSQMLRSLINTLGINSLYLVTMVLPMLFAVFLSEIGSTPYRKVVQTLTTIPNFISWVLVYSAFYALLSTDGMVNNLAVHLGLAKDATNYLADPSFMWVKMLLYHHWKSLGWSAILYISAITAIDREIYEAADIDGAGRFVKMFRITIPHLMPTFFVLFVLQIGNMLNNGMDQYLVFSNAMTKDSIEVLDLYVYNNGLKSGQISYATAIGMFKSVISLALLLGGNALSKAVRGETIF